MRAKELRALVGKQITWTEAGCRARGGIVQKGTVLKVQGKNVLVETGGMNDWIWAPDMRDLKACDSMAEHPAQEP